MNAISSPPTRKPRRRWRQFSLRTVLMLMLLFGAGLGWFGRQVQRARAQREAAEAITERGGRVSYEHVSRGGLRTALAWLIDLFGEDWSVDVTEVSLCGAWVSEAGLAHLRGLTQLEKLDLTRTNISDASVSDAVLPNLRGLTHLQVLSLSHASVTDAGLAHLRGLTQLQWLCLDFTQVSDAGLPHLHGLTLSFGDWTSSILRSRLQASPNCGRRCRIARSFDDCHTDQLLQGRSRNDQP